MTAPAITATKTSVLRRLSPTSLLLLLVLVTVLVTLLAPEAVEGDRGGPTSRSALGGGTRMFYELAQRMGWRASERVVPFDSIAAATSDPRSVEVVLQPETPMRRQETHALLEHVRGGGALLFDVEGDPDLADSLGLLLGDGRHLATTAGVDPNCPAFDIARDRRAFVLPPMGRDFRWRRPAPGEVTPIGRIEARTGTFSFGIGFPLGAGRIVALGASDVVTNDALRRCGWGGDVAAVRALEYLRPATATAPSLVFDEYHHGYGVKQGSPSAVTVYLSRTTSGRFLAQAMLAALILLLASMARPTLPHDPAQIPRRSPLEHADALANAYADVSATKTASQELVRGLRRRVGRVLPVPVTADDAVFLAGVVARVPSLAPHVAKISQALAVKLSPREFLAVGESLREVERQLTNTPARKS